MIGLNLWQMPPKTRLKVRQKALVPIRQIGTNPIFPTTSEQPKPAPILGFRGFVPMFRVFRKILNGLGLKNMKNTIHRHYLSRPGVWFKGNLRRIMKPLDRRAGHAPTCPAWATAGGVTICHRPTRPGTLFASCPTMAGRAARPGGCTLQWSGPICFRLPVPCRSRRPSLRPSRHRQEAPSAGPDRQKIPGPS